MLFGYFALIVALSLLRRLPLGGKAVYLLRLLLPSWRFFDVAGEVRTLFYRTGTDPTALGDWRPCLPLPRRRLRGLLLDAEVNLLLACSSLLDQLQSDLEVVSADDGVEALVSYRLVQNLVGRGLAGPATPVSSPTSRSTPSCYQFKVCVGPTLPHPAEGDELLISPVYSQSSARSCLR